MAVAADVLETAYVERGWTVERTRNTPTFRRLVLRSPRGQVLVDLAVDSPPLSARRSPPWGPPIPSRSWRPGSCSPCSIGPKPRDLVDIVAISRHLDVDRLREVATQIDAGFADDVLAEMLATHRRFTDDEIAELGGNADQVRVFADDWRARLIDPRDRPT